MNLSLINETIFYLTNEERIKRNLPPLLRNIELEKSAMLHSYNMVKDNFYSHKDWKNKDLHTPTDRIIFSGGKFNITGENIAKSPFINFINGFQTPQIFGIKFRFGTSFKELTPIEFAEQMVEGWMKSKGHRENILYKDFRFLGVGTQITSKKDGDKTFYGLCTQNFGG